MRRQPTEFLFPSRHFPSDRPISHIKIKFDLIEKRFTLASHFTNRERNVKLDFSVCKLHGTGSSQQQQLLNRFHCLSYLIPENLFNFSSPLLPPPQRLGTFCWHSAGKFQKPLLPLSTSFNFSD
jgi:hypothetical protein